MSMGMSRHTCAFWSFLCYLRPDAVGLCGL